MATFKQLSTEEIEAIRAGTRKPSGAGAERKAVVDGYQAELVRVAEDGGWAELDLAENDKRETEKARLQRAAHRAGLKLEFKRTRGDALRFKVIRNGRTPETEYEQMELA